MSGYLNAEGKALWRAARDAEPNGINREQAEAALGKDGIVLKSRLQNMTRAGYLDRTGEHGSFLWRIGSKVPHGEELVAGGTPPDDDDVDVPLPRREGVNGVPPGVPNSVFQLGATMAAAASSPPAAATPARAAAPAPAPAPAVDLSSWKPAKALASAADLMAVVEEHQQANRHDPYFALTSENTFVISLSNHEEPLILDASTTRAMFRWLDRLGGLGLANLVMAEEQTA